MYTVLVYQEKSKKFSCVTPILFFFRALGFSKSESEEIGRRSKRLIDAGRVWYLKQFEMDASLLYYVDRSVSLENVALIAWNSGRKVKKKGRVFVIVVYIK